jgi:IS30 family transposase
MTRLRRYAGRVEFFAVKEEIQELLQKGYGYKMIHEKLTADEKITIKYITFYQYLKPGKKSAQKNPQ